MSDLILEFIKKSGGWLGGWMDGWMDGLKAILRFALSNQKVGLCKETLENLVMILYIDFFGLK